MKITGSGRVGTSGPAKGSGPSRGGAVFSPIMPGAAQEAASVSGPHAVAGVGSLEALIALQEVGGPLERRRRAVSRAGRLLDSLDAVKVALLDGRMSPAILEGLARGVREQRQATDEPGLESLLNEIETRAGVELAKLEMARSGA